MDIKVVIFFYLMICSLWTLIKFRINTIKKFSFRKKILYAFFDFILYPISFFISTYVEILENLKYDGTKGKEKK